MTKINLVSLILCLRILSVKIFVEGLHLENKHVKKSLVFPEQVDEVIKLVPKCNNNKTFCEDVESYPGNTFYKILQNSQYKDEYFKKQTVPDDSISNRFHPDREYYICESKIRTEFPRVALNSKNQWKFVYNIEEYRQGIITEECAHETSCTTFQRTPRGIRTRCMQRYSDRLLLVANEEGEPVWDLFWFPSSCICAYEHSVHLNFKKD